MEQQGYSACSLSIRLSGTGRGVTGGGGGVEGKRGSGKTSPPPPPLSPPFFPSGRLNTQITVPVYRATIIFLTKKLRHNLVPRFFPGKLE